MNGLCLWGLPGGDVSVEPRVSGNIGTAGRE